MALLAYYNDKYDFEGEDVTVPGAGPVQLLVRGGYGADGLVRLLLKGADGEFHAYRELTFSNHNSAVEVGLFAGDVVRAQFVSCEGASLEIRQ